MILAICISNVMTLFIVLFLLYRSLKKPQEFQAGEAPVLPKSSMKPFAKKGRLKPKVMDDQALWKKEQEEFRR